MSERTKDEWVRELHTGPRKCPRLVVVPNGIRVERLIRRRSIEAAKLELGVQPDALVIGSIGRLDWAKGYRDMIAALPTILKAAPNAVFVHAGLGPLDGLLQDDARRLGVSGSIVWLGFRSDVRDLLEASDLYVQPSWCEAHTLSVLEAGAMSLAVVASDVGGHRETLESDRGGWIVAPRQPEELASAVMTALGDAVARQTRGRWLGSRVRTYYTHDRMVAETMALYENLFTTAGAS